MIFKSIAHYHSYLLSVKPVITISHWTLPPQTQLSEFITSSSLDNLVSGADIKEKLFMKYKPLGPVPYTTSYPWPPTFVTFVLPPGGLL